VEGDYTDPVAPAYLKTVSDIINGIEVSLFRFIDPAKHEAIFAKTNTDDLTVNIQDALTAIGEAGRGSILAPAGLYHHTLVIAPTAPGIQLRGTGRTTIFKPIGPAWATAMFYAASSDGLVLKDLQYDIDKVAYPDLTGIFITGTTGSRMSDVYFANSGSQAVYTLDCTDMTMERVVSMNARMIGFKIVNPVRGLIKESAARYVENQHGMYIENAANIQIANCITTNCGQFGLNMTNSNRGSVLNHRSQDTRLEGINLMDTNYVEIDNPHLYWSNDPAWLGMDMGLSIFGNPAGQGMASHNKVRGGIIINSCASGVGLAEMAEYNTIDGVTIINPNNRVNPVEASGSAVWLYAGGVKYNTVTNIKAFANNGRMHHAVYEEDYLTLGAPSYNKVSRIDSVGHGSAKIRLNDTTSVAIDDPSAGGALTLATLEGVEVMYNKTIQVIGNSPGAAGLDILSYDNTGNAGLTITHQNLPGTFDMVRGQDGLNTLYSTSDHDLAIGRNGTTDLLIKHTSGNVEATKALTSKSPSAGIGYSTGAGGVVAQATNKSTNVSLATICGAIITHDAELGPGEAVSFQVTNSAVREEDFVGIHRRSGGSKKSYWVYVDETGDGYFEVVIQNLTGAPLSQSVTFNYQVTRLVNS